MKFALISFHNVANYFAISFWCADSVQWLVSVAETFGWVAFWPAASTLQDACNQGGASQKTKILVCIECHLIFGDLEALTCLDSTEESHYVSIYRPHLCETDISVLKWCESGPFSALKRC